MLQAFGFDARTVDPVEAADEAENVAEVLQPVVGVAAERAAYRTPAAEPARPVQPDDEVGARQTDVEGGCGEVAVADPGVGRVSFHKRRAEALDIIVALRAPERVEVDDRGARAFAEAAGESGLAGAGAAQDDDACQSASAWPSTRGSEPPTRTPVAGSRAISCTAPPDAQPPMRRSRWPRRSRPSSTSSPSRVSTTSSKGFGRLCGSVPGQMSQRGASAASCTSWPWSMRPLNTCRFHCGWPSPPGVPPASTGSPSASVTR